MKRRIGVLTSGGDCAGLNAVIRAVTYNAVRVYGWKVIGIMDGSAGLIERPLRFRELTLEKASGGSRQPEFASTHPNPGNRIQKIREELQKMGQ